MQIDQEDQPVIQGMMADSAARQLNGQFSPGVSGNPNGPPPVAKGMQRPADRIAYLGQKYTTDEIQAFAESQYLRSKLPYWDSVYVMWMARAANPELTKTRAGTDDLRGERKELLDRLHGQTKASTEITGPGGSQLLPLIKIVFEGNNELSTVGPNEEAEAPVTIDQRTNAGDQQLQEQPFPADVQTFKIEME